MGINAANKIIPKKGFNKISVKMIKRLIVAIIRKIFCGFLFKIYDRPTRKRNANKIVNIPVFSSLRNFFTNNFIVAI